MIVRFLPLLKDKEHRTNDEQKADNIIPLQFFAQIDDRENTKDEERNNFLDGLKLGRRKLVRAQTVRRDLKAILGKGDEPANQNDLPERGFLKLEMSIPGGGYEDVRDS